ncbi:MAG: serine/threonine-protein kinase, partial [Myxococcota bacterium]
MSEDDAESSTMAVPEVVPKGELARVAAAARRGLFGSSTPGAKIGRFTILERIGSGGMGVVYAAHDPDLERRIAIKVLKGPGVSDSARSRVRREAQAIARIKHPNVIHVYETGNHEGELYLAMEHIQGETLGAWLAREPRSLPEVLAAFRGAGQGLAAAHAVDVMHRDFKPDNVLVDRHDEVHVLDFGLARGASASGELPPSQPNLEDRDETLLDSPLTATGTVMGTPAYMAPEQALGETTTPQVDQFSFCVALWEAVYGVRPFASHEGKNLLAALRSGCPPDPPPADRKVPRQLAQLLHRGLSHAPEDRYASMDELLADMPPDPSVGRRRRRLGASLAGLGAIAIAGTYYAAREQAAVDCHAEASQQISGVWDDATRERLRARFSSRGRTFSDTAWTNTAALLDEEVEQWTVAQVATCEAMTRQQNSNPRVLEKRACLQRRLAQLQTTISILVDGEATLLDEAAPFLAGLDSVSDCEDPELARRVLHLPDDPDDAREVQAVRIIGAEARAHAIASNVGKATTLFEQTVERAKAVAYPPLVAETMLGLGRHLVAVDPTRAETILRETINVAAAAHHDGAAADAWLALILLVGRVQQRGDEAMAMLPGAQFAIQQAGNDAQRRATLLSYWGEVEAARANFDASDAKFAEALDTLQKAGLDRGLLLAQVLTRWSGLALERHQHQRALDLGQRALEIEQSVRGRGHPSSLATLANLGGANLQLGHLEQARKRYNEMLEAWGSTQPDEDRYVAFGLDNLAIVDQREGKLDDALRRHLRALKIRERVLPPGHTEIGASHHNVGLTAMLSGDQETARRHYGLAVETHERSLGRSHPHTARAVAAVGTVDLAEGRHAEARAALTEALPVMQKAFGRDATDVLEVELDLAQLEHLEGRPEAALKQFEGLEPRIRVHGDDGQLGRTQVGILRALHALERDPERQTTLAALAS